MRVLYDNWYNFKIRSASARSVEAGMADIRALKLLEPRQSVCNYKNPEEKEEIGFTGRGQRAVS